MSDRFGAIADALRSAHRILVLSHARPDGDAIGSQLALAFCLIELDKEVKAWNEDGLPDNFRFLAGSSLVTRPPASPEHFDLVVALDTANRERLGSTLTAVAPGARWINIDHHASNPAYGDLNFVQTNSPATGQIIFDLLIEEGFPISAPMADALFAAISTDTGSFRYENTSAHTFHVAGELVRLGVSPARLSFHLYEQHPKRRILLLAELLRQITFAAEDRVASLSLTEETKRRLQILPFDIDGLIDAVRAIDTVVVAIFFEEVENGRIRISMRSKDRRIDVNKICGKFGGGGHTLAAGARMRGTLSEVRTNVLTVVVNEVSEFA